MNIKTFSKILMAISVLVLLISFNMDTSVSTGYGRVNNIGLIAQQQNLLLISGIGFLAGIVLFATAKIKQTPEDEMIEKARPDAHVTNLQTTGKILTLSFGSYWKNLDNKKGRILIFLYYLIVILFFSLAYFLTYRISDFYKTTKISYETILSIFYFGPAIYILMPLKAITVIRHTIFLILSIVALSLIRLLLIFFQSGEFLSGFYFFVFIGVVSAFILHKVNISQKRKLVSSYS